MTDLPNVFRPTVLPPGGVIEPYESGQDYWRQQTVTHTVHEAVRPSTPDPAPSPAGRRDVTGLPSARVLTSVANFLLLLGALLAGAFAVTVLLVVIRLWGALT